MTQIAQKILQKRQNYLVYRQKGLPKREPLSVSLQMTVTVSKNRSGSSMTFEDDT